MVRTDKDTINHNTLLQVWIAKLAGKLELRARDLHESGGLESGAPVANASLAARLYQCRPAQAEHRDNQDTTKLLEGLSRELRRLSKPFVVERPIRGAGVGSRPGTSTCLFRINSMFCAWQTVQGCTVRRAYQHASVLLLVCGTNSARTYLSNDGRSIRR
jgi:hypothetical protein